MELSNITIGIIGIVILLLFMLLKMPIGFAFLTAGSIGITLIRGFGPATNAIGAAPFWQTASYVLAAAALFILMGQFVSNAGLAEDIYDTGYKWFGSISGGLAMATMVACTGFAACTGSSMASALTIASLGGPQMKRYRYEDGFATAVIAAGGTLGILIPPSLIMIIYGYFSEVSIGKLFAAGIVPGLMIATFLMAGIYILCRRNPILGPSGPRFSWKEKLVSLKGVVGVLVLFLLIMGGLYLGVFTPTEAGAAGAFGAFLIALLRRRVSIKVFLASLRDSVVNTCMALTILIGAMVFGSFLSQSGIPMALSNWVGNLPLPPIGIMMVILLMYVPLGCFIDSLPMVLLTLPIVFPIILKIGIDPIWFGVLLVLMCEISLITPPVGINVFVISGASGVPVKAIFRSSVFFVLVFFIGLAVLIAFPQITLFIPDLMKF